MPGESIHRRIGPRQEPPAKRLAEAFAEGRVDMDALQAAANEVDPVRYVVLTHDLDKPDHWWADGPFDSTGAAHEHMAKLGKAALDHRVIALVHPEKRAQYEGWRPR